MNVTVAEMTDRYSICCLKYNRAYNDNVRRLAKLELDAIWYELAKYDVADYIKRLYEINGKIWDLESDIRQGKEKELGLEEVGRRSIQIRDNNGIRIMIKNEINEKFNEGFVEIKC
jgi:hypothetical protein